jgi:drug/metabolite transporter (DMT)-like permease
MAQTKRKRRSKHRGNAAGKVEARGRTGRRPTPEEVRKAGRDTSRRNKPPTWNGAFMKAALMAGVLFVLTRFGVFGSDASVTNSLVLCAFAVLLYTPLAYVTDKWVYDRNQRRLQAQKQKPNTG